MDRGSLTDLIHKWRDVDYGEELMSAVLFQVTWRARTASALVLSVECRPVHVESSAPSPFALVAVLASKLWGIKEKIQPRKDVLDGEDFAGRTRQHELDHTDHTDHTDHKDHTDEGHICPD